MEWCHTGFAIAGVKPLSVHYAKQRKSFVCTLYDLECTNKGFSLFRKDCTPTIANPGVTYPGILQCEQISRTYIHFTRGRCGRIYKLRDK